MSSVKALCKLLAAATAQFLMFTMCSDRIVGVR